MHDCEAQPVGASGFYSWLTETALRVIKLGKKVENGSRWRGQGNRK